MDTYARDFGAISNTNTVQTTAIQAAIDACEKSGGGTVHLDSGTYITGTVYLRTNTYLYIPYMCTLKGSDNFADYNDPCAWPQNTPIPAERANGMHLIVGLEIENSGIFGGGAIDGNGSFFGFKNEEGFSRPSQMVYLCESKNLRIRDLELKNSTYWTMHVYGCEDVIISGLHITNNPNIPCCDGIDVDCSKRVVISDCIINTEDDCITLRGNNSLLGSLKDKSKCLEDVTVTNCQLCTNGCNAFRIGVGNNAIRNCTISNVVIRNSSKGVCLESRYVFNDDEKPGTKIENISFNNVYMECVCPIYISSHCLGITNDPSPDIRNVSFSNLTITAKEGIIVQSNENAVVEGISFNNVILNLENSEKLKFLEKFLADKVYTSEEAPIVIDKYGYSEWDYATPPAAFTVANVKKFNMNNVNISIDKELPIDAGIHLYNTIPSLNNVTAEKDGASTKLFEVRK